MARLCQRAAQDGEVPKVDGLKTPNEDYVVEAHENPSWQKTIAAGLSLGNVRLQLGRDLVKLAA
jgi:hypothetical protein